MSAQVEQPTFLTGGIVPHGLDEVSAITSILQAGARARAVAEACESVGVAALLLDATGRVLHASRSAQELLGTTIRIEAGHVLGGDSLANAAIETVLNPVLSQKPGCADVDCREVLMADAAQDGSLVIAALPYGDDLQGQLLKAVLVLGSSRDNLYRRLTAVCW